MAWALVLVAMAAVIWNLRNRLLLVEQRLADLERKGLPEKPRSATHVTARIVQRPAPVIAPEAAEPTPPPVRPEPVETPDPQPERPRRTISFEDLFGRKLPIWAGGVTLAVAGVLLVKYSIDAGLLSPAVRIILGLFFGAGLIAGAEVALRNEQRVRDPRVAQSLAGAGLATLYVATLAAHSLYALIGPMTAFAGLAAVTALAMGLSLRFGSPSALLGLVGGLAAPALVGAGQPDVPLLACYLALAIGGLVTLSRRQRWLWLGVGALAGGAGWGAALMLTGALDASASISVGLLLIALGVGFPLLAFGSTPGTSLQRLAAIVAAAQMAVLVATGGFALLHWGLFGLLAVALLWLGGRDQALRPLGAVGLGVALFLAGTWPHPDTTTFTAVMLGMAAIFGAPSLWRLWRAGGSLIEASQIAALSLGGVAVTLGHFLKATPDQSLALIALAATTLPAFALIMGWRKDRDDARYVTLSTATGLLVATAGAVGLSSWTLAIVTAAVASAMLMLAIRAKDSRIDHAASAFAASAIALLVASAPSEAARLFGIGHGLTAEPILRWAAIALMATLFATRARLAEARLIAQALALLAAYGAAAQIVPAAWLPLVPALALPLLATRKLLPAAAIALTLSLGWAAWPLGQWTAAALLSLVGAPMLAIDLPTLADTPRRLALPAAMLALIAWHVPLAIPHARRIVQAGAAILGGVATHILYKQLFHLSGSADVMGLALTERTLWEALLLGAAALLWRADRMRQLALVLAVAALAHGVYYTVLLHDPLWADQAVGGWPLANLLLPAFGLPFAALALIGRNEPWLAEKLWRPADIVRMALIALFALASLRQLFAGSLLTAGSVGGLEDILRSVLAIGLAIGFLLWGIRDQARDWRIASLLLMLGAVAKVFLFDASGLDGLLRIASFLALGFSLIGIGWLYNRVLREPAH